MVSHAAEQFGFHVMYLLLYFISSSFFKKTKLWYLVVSHIGIRACAQQLPHYVMIIKAHGNHERRPPEAVYPQFEVSTLLNQPLCHVTRPRPACLHQRRPARALLMYACITLLLLSSSSSPYICIYYIFLQGLMRGAQPTPCFKYIHIFYCHYLF